MPKASRSGSVNSSVGHPRASPSDLAALLAATLHKVSFGNGSARYSRALPIPRCAATTFTGQTVPPLPSSATGPPLADRYPALRRHRPTVLAAHSKWLSSDRRPVAIPDEPPYGPALARRRSQRLGSLRRENWPRSGARTVGLPASEACRWREPDRTDRSDLAGGRIGRRRIRRRAGPLPVTSLALNLMALVAVVAPVWSTTATTNMMTASTLKVCEPSSRMATRPSAYGGEQTRPPMAPPDGRGGELVPCRPVRLDPDQPGRHGHVGEHHHPHHDAQHDGDTRSSPSAGPRSWRTRGPFRPTIPQ